MKSRFRIVLAVLGIVALAVAAQRPPDVKEAARLLGQSSSQPAAEPKVVGGYGNLPLSFEPNQGQSDQQVKFLARGSGYTLFLTAESAVLMLRKGDLKDKGQIANAKTELQPSQSPASQMSARDEGSQTQDTVLRMRVAGANPRARVSGQEELAGKSNYFIGNDPKQWRTNVPNYAEVKYPDVYPGVDLIYYGNQGQLEYDFVLQPGADPKRIVLDLGTEPDLTPGGPRNPTLRIGKNGDLLIATEGGKVVLQKPMVYQPKGDYDPRTTDKQIIEGKYVLIGAHQVGFQVAAYDHSKPLVIDPTLVYSTYLGGTYWDKGNAIAADALGHAFITGKTLSTNFPTTSGVFKRTLGGRASNIFVTEMNPGGSGLIYSTYLGGTGPDEPFGITVDASGSAYVTGWTASSNFPTTKGALQTTPGGGYDDAFVTKLSPTGSALVYSTYLGGKSYDEAHGIAVDASGHAYVTGLTYSSNFPIVAGAHQSALGGYDDAFVSKLNPTGTALIYSTYLGGSGYDEGHGIAIDSSGNAYVTGFTYSSNFPTTRGVLQTTARGGFDAFVTKLNATGSTLLYSTYLGGSNDDFAYGIAVDSSGNAFVTGKTYSSNFPTTAGAFQTKPGISGGYDDAFVVKLNPAGSALVYSTYLGGSGHDAGAAIAIDALGDAAVTGDTYSTNFPTTPGAFQTTLGGLNVGFMSKLNATGSALLYSTYMGGVNTQAGTGIAVDASDNIYVVGWSNSNNFPTSTGAFEPKFAGNQNAFVVVINVP